MYRREEQRVAHHFAQLRLVVSEAAARTAQRERRTQHHGIAYLARYFGRFVGRRRHFRRQHRLAQRLAQLLEELAVLGPLYRLERRAQNLHLALGQNTLLGQLHRQVEPRLPAQPRHDGVRALVADDFGHIFQRQRLHIDLVGDVGVGHDGRRVGVHQHHFVALLAQCQARLRPRVVEFRGLSDDYRARTDDQYLAYVFSLRHFCAPPSF